jgi:hypothetical protein
LHRAATINPFQLHSTYTNIGPLAQQGIFTLKAFPGTCDHFDIHPEVEGTANSLSTVMARWIEEW